MTQPTYILIEVLQDEDDHNLDTRTLINTMAISQDLDQLKELARQHVIELDPFPDPITTAVTIKSNFKINDDQSFNDLIWRIELGHYYLIQQAQQPAF